MGDCSVSEASDFVVISEGSSPSDHGFGRAGHFAGSSLHRLFASVSDDIQRLTVQQLSKAPKMPWDCEPMNQVFGKSIKAQDTNFDQCFVGLRDYAQVAVRPDPSEAPPAWVSIFSSKGQRIVATAVSPDDMRCRSLLLMKTMLESAPTLPRLGSQLFELHSSKQFEKLWTVLEDSYAEKSTGTLYKRSRALWSYYCWLRDTGRSVVFALSEEWIYDYLSHARSKNAAATHGSSFLQSIAFLHGACAWVSDPTAMISARVPGVSIGMYKGKRTLQQFLVIFYAV